MTNWKKEAAEWENACRTVNKILDDKIAENKKLKEELNIKLTKINELELTAGAGWDNYDHLKTIMEEDSKTVSDLQTEVKGLRAIVQNLKARKGMNYADCYQEQAARTMAVSIGAENQKKHAMHGMVGEIGELHSIYQKVYQGHIFNQEHAKKELGDLLWFIAEYCTACEWKLSEVMDLNIEKLIARYPEGFDPEKSLHRADGDI